METNKKIFKIKPNGLENAEFVQRKHVVYVSDEITLDDVLKPEAWQHVASELTPWDVVEVRWEDLSKKALLTVLDATGLSANVALEGDVIDLDGGNVGTDGNLPFFVKYRGAAKWCVIRESDNEVVGKGYSNRKLAETEMFNQLKEAS